VRMPPDGALLLGQKNLVSEIGSWLDGALCYELWPIVPRVPGLVHAVPADMPLFEVR
jgi:hypothetical protein